jgi:DNA-binding transcriptional ArsR family regulator
MTQKRIDAGLIEDDAALAALVSTVRQEIVDTIEAGGGDVAVADIAAQVGRSAESVRHHLRRLVDSGILREGDDPGDGRGRRYRTAADHGKRMRLKYGRGMTADPSVVERVVAGLLGTAERDFRAALRSGEAIGEGPRRDLWASRLKGWISDDDLREINRLLVRLSDLLQQPRDLRRNHLVTLAWMLAPIDGKAPRLERDGSADADDD